MKKLVKTLLVCGFASAMVATSAFAQPFIVTLDENGNGSLTGLQPGGTPIGASIQVDPNSGQEGLFYNFGPVIAATGVSITTGDITLSELGSTDPSDLIRFVNFPGLQGIFFFSLLDDASAPDIADVDTLPDVIGNPLAFIENGPEGANGLLNYRPTAAGQPGYVPQAPGVVFYNFISDAAPVPEPGTLALFGLAGGLLALFWRQRSGRA